MSSPVPYLGSKISLISKSEIRYEGILYTIDAQESIIALAKVKSFGTEDRPVELHVPARDDVYEYIIFRGTDIKKIEVCEAPKQPMVALHNDPAIVQASSFGGGVRHSLGPIGGGAPPPPSYAGYPQTLGQQQMAAPAAPSFMSAATSAQPTLAEMLGSRSPTPSQLTAAAAVAAIASRKSPVSDAGVQVSPPPQDNKRKAMKEGNKHAHEDQEARMNRRDGQGYNTRRNQYNFGQGYNYNPSFNQGFRNHGFHNNFYGFMGRGGMGRGGGMMNRGGPGNGRRMRGGHMGRGGGTGMLPINANRQKEDKALFQEDYDFELANNKFEKLRSEMSNAKIGSASEETNSASAAEPAEESAGEKEKAKENEEPEEANQPICYDKTKSFFDSISCEAIERSMGRSQRPDWRLERKINQETFGVSSARRGGGGGGYYNRGRGGYFSRGGGGNFYRGGYNQGYYRGSNYRGNGGHSSRGNSNKNNPTTNGTTNKTQATSDKAPARATQDPLPNV